MVLVMFCNFYVEENHKIANNSTTTDARENISTHLESLEYYKKFKIHLTTTLSIMTASIMSFSITSLSIMILSKVIHKTRRSACWQNVIMLSDTYAECHI